MNGQDPPTHVAQTLISAYRATHYCVTAVDEPFVMRIDERSDDLAVCHRTHSVTCSAFLTAYNPHSQPTAQAENDAAQERLEHVLREAGYRWLEGLGIDPSGDWPAEPSLLVMGMGLDDARAIGTRFAQNGFIWAASDSVPRLVMLR